MTNNQPIFLEKIEDIFDEINALFAANSNKFLKIIDLMTDYFIQTIKNQQLLGTQSRQIMEDFSNALKQPVISLVSQSTP